MKNNPQTQKNENHHKKDSGAPKVKNIFSTARITRLIFTAWLIALVITVLVITALNLIFPYFTSLHYLILALIFYGISTLMGMLIFYFLTKKTNTITAQINSAIFKIAEGDFSARLSFPTGNADIDNVVNNFNKMAQELNALSLINNDFVSNFSHEFKTPIASIKGYAELLLEDKTLTSEQKQYLEVIAEESTRLSHLSENVITLGKLDGNNTQINKEIFWLDEELNRCILLFDRKLNENAIQLEADFEHIKISADKMLSKEIWINLMSNAIKFTPRGKKIKISAFERTNFAFVIFENEGENIPDTELKNIFRRYYQLRSAEAKGGSGLGLAITKRIIELHKGTIIAENVKPSGVRFVVKLPISID